MAGFLGLFDYSRPGKGVQKDEPPKSRFVHFWELLARKFWKLIQLNLLYILFCVPIVTIGPASAGFTYVLRNMSDEQPVFMFSDFWDAFKSNWKQSSAYSAFMVVFAAVGTVALRFYALNLNANLWMYIPLAMMLFMMLMVVMMSFYVMLMIVTLDLPLKSLLKNGAILSIVCLKTNFFTLLFCGLVVAVTILLLPYSILGIILFTPAFIGFIVCYNSYPGIKKYAVAPYPSSGEGGTDKLLTADTESLFRDGEITRDQ